jgi:hypothetical protein
MELRRAIGEGAKRKSPGLDGLSIECYITICDNIKEDLLRVYKEMVLPRHMCVMNIKWGPSCVFQKLHIRTPLKTIDQSHF